MASLEPAKAIKQRDGRLDVLRGLCLVNMIVVHLYDQGMGGPPWLHELLVHWFRFAAGGFIATSGMCIGAIHARRALDPTKRLKTYRSLVQRAGLVLLVHYFSVFASLLVIPFSGQPVHDVGQMVRDGLYFYTGYELLLFYVVMLLAAPVMIEIIRRFGVLTLLAISAGVFCIKPSHPYLGLYALENHFPIVRWQLVFAVGVAGGSLLARFDKLSPAIKWKLFAGSASASLAIAGYSAAIRAGWFAVPAVLDVIKFPLSPMEALRYATLTLAIGLLVDRSYKWFAGTAADSVLRTMGAQSLLLWVVHIYITAQFVQMRWVYAIALSLAGAWIIAAGGMAVAKWWQAHVKGLPKIGYVSPVLGSLLAIAILRIAETPADISAPAPTAIAATDIAAKAATAASSATADDFDLAIENISNTAAIESPPIAVDDDPFADAT